eukprot:gene37427-46172_t
MAPGLALDGPVGSMARSVDGMKEELPIVTFFFGCMMISFFCTTILGSWTVMGDTGSMGSTGVFHWDKSEVMWDGSVAEPGGRHSSVDTRGSEFANKLREDPALAEANPATIGGAHNEHRPSDQRPSDQRPSTDARPSMFGLPNFLGRSSMGARPSMSNVGQRPSILEMMPNLNITAASTAQLAPAKINLKDVAMEGYLSKRIKSKKEFSHEPWERRYFVLNYKGEFYYYKTRPIYRSDPVGGREEKRPIELDDYLVKYYNSITPHALEPIAAKYDDGNSSEDKTSTELEFTVESSVDSSNTKSTRKSLAAK